MNSVLWNTIQDVLGFPDFKKELYRSVLTPPGRLLDFGCATGHIADAFFDFDYYGIDINPKAVKAAKERFKTHPSAKFLAADIYSRPYEPDYFDEILFACTAHHLADESLVTILSELHYCLKPGKTIHLLDPVFRQKDRWPARFFRRIDRGPYTRDLDGLMALVGTMQLFEVGEPAFRTPPGTLIQQCDFVHLPLQKKR